LLTVVAAPASQLILFVSAISLILLALLGGIAARAGGAGIVAGALRVLIWGALAMAVTAGIGHLFGAVI
jgi:VIT1/CCC1 family predicted Fe2+/Mn2+ transporter